MEWLSDPNAWIGLLTLTLLEIVLGIDNIVFISIISEKLPKPQQPKARQMGLLAALGTRILLLFSLSWLVRLTNPLFEIMGHGYSGRDLILLLGGLFLIGKATHEIHTNLEGADGSKSERTASSFGAVIVQIMLLDIVFSLDSVITAVGMVEHVAVMVAAVLISIIIMMISVNHIAAYIERHPSIKILALSFLILIGVSLIGDGTGHHIPKGYVYSAMAFSVMVEFLNQLASRKVKPVKMHQPYR
ncbi:MAG: TerC family protein [Acidobacteria bacterium]|nr:TerC family protein [Acidobacteriota bacterium]